MVKNITHRIVASAAVVFLLVGGVDAAASGKYPCVATCGSASTPVCGASASDVTNNQCGTGSATYEGCSKSVCDEVCGGSTSVTTATMFPVTVNVGSVEYKCFDAENLMYMSTSANADANAKMQSVAMNCNTAGTTDGSSHTMNSGAMYMAGGTDHECEKWVVGAAGGSKSSVFAFALAGAAVAAAL
jgi:hypothetical protein